MTRQEILAIAKPILFNTRMTQAVQDDCKTATRRLTKPQPTERLTCGANWQELLIAVAAPYQPGDLLHVREAWYFETHMYDPSEGAVLHRYQYRALNPDYPVNVGAGKQGWRPSIHMPKEAARLFLRVTAVRVERLQEITEEGAKAEGAFPPVIDGSCRDGFADLWNTTIKPTDLPLYDWDANPWVWVIEFERVMPDA